MIARPELHTGRRCSRDCAEYGCAEWTGIDERVLADRRERGRRIAARIRRATDHIGRGTYEAAKHAASAESRPAPEVPAAAGTTDSGVRP